jgi:hypothetical protein
VNRSMFVLSTRYRGQVLDIDRNVVYRHIDKCLGAMLRVLLLFVQKIMEVLKCFCNVDICRKDSGVKI